jgi:hypothetical protein
MATVTIACAVGGGLIIGNDAFNNPIVLTGPNASGVNYGSTEAFGLTDVDETAWNNWLAIYGNSPAVTTGAVWQVT